MAGANDKDRHSRMAASTVNAPMKKGGAGGQYTWGSPMDGQDYVPVGMTMQPTVTVVAAPQQFVYHTAQPVPVVADASQFPVLGAPPKMQTGPVAWGPVGTVAANVAALSEDQLRAGSAELFDSSHPRNTFAKKPHHAGDGHHQLAVDWTQPGSAGFHQHFVQHGANPAHLNQYQLAAVAAQPMQQALPPMQQAYPVQQFVQAPHIQQYMMQPQHQQYQQQPQMHVRRPMVMQGRGR